MAEGEGGPGAWPIPGHCARCSRCGLCCLLHPQLAEWAGVPAVSHTKWAHALQPETWGNSLPWGRAHLHLFRAAALQLALPPPAPCARTGWPGPSGSCTEQAWGGPLGGQAAWWGSWLSGQSRGSSLWISPVLRSSPWHVCLSSGTLVGTQLLPWQGATPFLCQLLPVGRRG